ncbi:MAG: DUF2946 family protein [Pseudomonadota bacterium]
MDESVIKAMERWPNVPDVYGWLALDRRGQWLLKGGTIGNVGLREFIGRNYLRTETGAFAFQNGPQRVFVALEYTPWVAQLDGHDELRLHNGDLLGPLDGAWMDEEGALLLRCAAGLALLDDRDLERLTDDLWQGDQRLDEDGQAEVIEALLSGEDPDVVLVWKGQHVALRSIRAREVAERFAFIADPQPDAA